MNKVGLVIGALFLAVGLYFVSAALGKFEADSKLVAKGAVAQGTVVELGRFSVARGKIRYRSIVEFRDRSGNRHRFVSDAATRSPGHAKGQQLAVIYDPANPADAAIDSFAERRLVSLIYGFLGSAFTLFGGAILFGALKGRARLLKRDKFGRRLRKN